MPSWAIVVQKRGAVSLMDAYRLKTLPALEHRGVEAGAPLRWFVLSETRSVRE